MPPPSAATQVSKSKLGSSAFSSLDRSQVVGLEDLAGLLALPVPLGQPRLQGHDARGGAGGVGALGELEHALEVGDVLLADLGELLLAVVALVGQADAALEHVEDVALGVLVVGVHVGAEHPAAAAPLERPEERGQRGEVGEGVDLLQQPVDRSMAELLDALLVHEAVVEVADLGGLAALDRPVGAGRDDVAYLLLRDLGKGHEGSPGGPVGGDLRGREPAAVDVTEQVVLHADVVVHALAGVVEHRHAGESTHSPRRLRLPTGLVLFRYFIPI